MEEISFNERIESEACAQIVHNWEHVRISRNAKLTHLARWVFYQSRIKRKLPLLIIDNEKDFVIKKKYLAGVYSGQVCNFIRSGVGYYKFLSGMKYYGEWYNNKPNGQGYLIISREKYYKGNFVLGKFEGFGEFVDGQDYYKGEWENDQKCGWGEEKVGEIYYKGEFKDGKKHGKGVIKCSNGRYKGTFVDGELKNGAFYPKNRRYSCSGVWLKDEFTGDFKLNLKNSSVRQLSGRFQQNSLIQGTLTLCDNKRLSIISNPNKY